MKKNISYLIIFIITNYLFISTASADSQSVDSKPVDYEKMINSGSYACAAPIPAYINDEVILGKKATFDEFIDVFPSNRADFLQMYNAINIYKIDADGQHGDVGYCAGRYQLVEYMKVKEIAKYWSSLRTKENLFQWYQITLSNLAGEAGADGYEYYSETVTDLLWSTSPDTLADRMLALKALKSLPLSTQKVLVNATSLSGDGRAIFKIKGIDTKQRCDNDYCAYLKTLVDVRFIS